MFTLKVRVEEAFTQMACLDDSFGVGRLFTPNQRVKFPHQKIRMQSKTYIFFVTLFPMGESITSSSLHDTQNSHFQHEVYLFIFIHDIYYAVASVVQFL